MCAASYIKLLKRKTKWTTISRACWKSVRDRKTRVHCGRVGTGRGMPRVKCNRNRSKFLEVSGYSRPAVQSCQKTSPVNALKYTDTCCSPPGFLL